MNKTRIFSTRHNYMNVPSFHFSTDENWNPIEWDRAAEELTWERLLGLDGSLVFLVSHIVVIQTKYNYMYID